MKLNNAKTNNHKKPFIKTPLFNVTATSKDNMIIGFEVEDKNGKVTKFPVDMKSWGILGAWNDAAAHMENIIKQNSKNK